MTGSGKKGQAYTISRGSKMRPNNNPDFMQVIRRLERCSDRNQNCELCVNLERCRSQFDRGITKYTDNAQYWGSIGGANENIKANIDV